MQLHQIKSTNQRKQSKRVGRGGKRGTYSGKGTKGQKARAGMRIRPGFRGGDNPIWKLFPKQRGQSSKVEVKHRTFALSQVKPAIVSLRDINKYYQEGDSVTPKTLVSKGVLRRSKSGVKVLANGELKKKLRFSGLTISEAAKTKILQTGGVIQ